MNTPQTDNNANNPLNNTNENDTITNAQSREDDAARVQVVTMLQQAQELGKSITLDPRDVPSGKDLTELFERHMGQFLHDLQNKTPEQLAPLAALHDVWAARAKEIEEFLPESSLAIQAQNSPMVTLQYPVMSFILTLSIGWYLRGKYEEELANPPVTIPGTSVRTN